MLMQLVKQLQYHHALWSTVKCSVKWQVLDGLDSPSIPGLCPTLLAACCVPWLACPFVPLYLGTLALFSDKVFLFFVSPMTCQFIL